MSSNNRSDILNPHTSGSPKPGEPLYLAIGKLQRTHGVKGEMIMDVLTDFPENIKIGQTVFVGTKHYAFQIASMRPHSNKLLMGFEGLSDCDMAANLRNQLVYIQTDQAANLPEGKFFHYEIIDMDVVTEENMMLGKVKEILITGANDVYVIAKPDGTEELIPAIRSVVLSIDRDSRKMVVRLPEWE